MTLLHHLDLRTLNGLLLQLQSLHDLVEGLEDLLLTLDLLVSPDDPLPCAELVLSMHVAVVVAMELIVHVLGFAAGTCAHLAAGLLGELRPESSALVVAGAAAAGSFAAGLARAGAGTGTGVVRALVVLAIGESVPRAEGRPVAPRVRVRRAGAALEVVSNLEVERRLQEISDVDLHGVVRDLQAGGQVGLGAGSISALELGFQDLAVGFCLIPRNHEVVAVAGIAGTDTDGYHLGGWSGASHRAVYLF